MSDVQLNDKWAEHHMRVCAVGLVAGGMTAIIINNWPTSRLATKYIHSIQKINDESRRIICSNGGLYEFGGLFKHVDGFWPMELSDLFVENPSTLTIETVDEIEEYVKSNKYWRCSEIPKIINNANKFTQQQKERLMTENTNLVASVARLENELALLAGTHDAQKNKVVQLEADVLARTDVIVDLSKKVEQLENDLKRADKTVESLRAELATVQAKNVKFGGMIDSLRAIVE